MTASVIIFIWSGDRSILTRKLVFARKCLYFSYFPYDYMSCTCFIITNINRCQAFPSLISCICLLFWTLFSASTLTLGQLYPCLLHKSLLFKSSYKPMLNVSEFLKKNHNLQDFFISGKAKVSIYFH